MQPNQNPSTNPTPAAGSNDEQPVAYDTQGRPLYLHPSDAPAPVTPMASAQSAPAPLTQYVHVSRALEPERMPVPADIKRLHDDSCRRFPRLNLSDGEYIINSVKRHPIGIVGIWLMAFGLIAGLFAVLFGIQSNGSIPGADNGIAAAAGGLVIMSILILIGAMVASYVYNQNRFYLTNESVIQEIQTTIFSKNEQTVSLANIEDASYRQDGILAYMFNFGTIRLSTEGDETTYRFSYVANPKAHIAILNNAVESFKNGRPITGSHQDQPS